MIITDFLTEKECNTLLLEVEGSNNWKPQNPNTGIFILKSKNHKLMIEIYEKVSDLFNISLHTQSIRMIHKTDSKSFWEEHSDDSGGSDILFGVVIYLNDNFIGGELVYPDLGVSIKPKQGMLVFHKGSDKHKVTKVLSGNRYTLTSFIRGKQNTLQNKDGSV